MKMFIKLELRQILEYNNYNNLFLSNRNFSKYFNLPMDMRFVLSLILKIPSGAFTKYTKYSVPPFLFSPSVINVNLKLWQIFIRVPLFCSLLLFTKLHSATVQYLSTDSDITSCGMEEAQKTICQPRKRKYKIRDSFVTSNSPHFVKYYLLSPLYFPTTTKWEVHQAKRPKPSSAYQ